MLNGRLYRAGLVPLLLAVAIAGFSLSGRAAPLTSTLAPDAFDGPRAFAELQSLAARFPRRRPGSEGDARLAAYIARTLEGVGGSAAGGFSVHTRGVEAPTIEGRRTLTTVIATRPGVTGASPIVLLAHRDAAGAGARAELSGTAALLELARVFATSETQRTIVLVSTS
ncbi:MAG: M28 family peptidase, partial [Solirubrobacterales bacterium]